MGSIYTVVLAWLAEVNRLFLLATESQGAGKYGNRFAPRVHSS